MDVYGFDWTILYGMLMTIATVALVVRLRRNKTISLADLCIGVVALPVLFVLGIMVMVGWIGAALFNQLDATELLNIGRPLVKKNDGKKAKVS